MSRLSFLNHSAIAKHRPAKDNGPAQPPRAKKKLSRDEVLALISRRGGADGLDLSGYDLSGVNLSKLDLTGVIFGSLSVLRDSDPTEASKAANLEGAWFERSLLRRANLARTNLRGARFYHADLRDATLFAADAEGADFRETNLTNADLYSASMRQCRLIGADLTGANLLLANLDGAELTADSLGAGLIQEDARSYREYAGRWYIQPAVGRAHAASHLPVRYAEAREIYLHLKNAFLSSGRYDDAGWAYFKERQAERRSFSPTTARAHYRDQVRSGKSPAAARWLAFHCRYLLRLAASLANELLTGYGERPLRVVFWSLVTVAIFPIFYWLSWGIATTSGSPIRWIDFFHYSLAAFSTIGFPDLVPVTDAAKTLTSIEALSGISALALLSYTLGKRIGRS